MSLSDTGEDSELVHRQKCPKVDTLFSSLFSDASERRVWLSAESKILSSTFGLFRLYRLKAVTPKNIYLKKSSLSSLSKSFSTSSKISVFITIELLGSSKISVSSIFSLCKSFGGVGFLGGVWKTGWFGVTGWFEITGRFEDVCRTDELSIGLESLLESLEINYNYFFDFD